jgi:hypothetical protein
MLWGLNRPIKNNYVMISKYCLIALYKSFHKVLLANWEDGVIKNGCILRQKNFTRVRSKKQKCKYRHQDSWI